MGFGWSAWWFLTNHNFIIDSQGPGGRSHGRLLRRVPGGSAERRGLWQTECDFENGDISWVIYVGNYQTMKDDERLCHDCMKFKETLAEPLFSPQVHSQIPPATWRRCQGFIPWFYWNTSKDIVVWKHLRYICWWFWATDLQFVVFCQQACQDWCFGIRGISASSVEWDVHHHTIVLQILFHKEIRM